MKILENNLTTADFIRLYESAGWGTKREDMVHVSLMNSFATFTVEQDGIIIGMARLLGDGGMSFYLKDLVILPEYQEQGIGRKLLEHVQCYIRARLEKGWTASLELMSAKGKETFYKKAGFTENPSEYLGAGMRKQISA